MAFKKITLELDGRWVLGRRSSEKLPISAFIAFCTETFGGNVMVESATLTECNIVIQNIGMSNEEIITKINGILTKKLEISNPSEIAKLKIKDIDDTSENISTVETTETQAIPKAAPDVGRMIHSYDRTAYAAEADISSADLKIASLVGAEEFKALAGEVKAIAPLIINHKTYETFVFQNYLFSINNGCGLSTCLNLFAELIDENKLFTFHGKQKVEEVKLLPPNDKIDPFAPVMSLLQSYRNDGGKLISIDISEWMTKTSDKQFRDFLSYLDDHMKQNIIVFRIPFVEGDVLADIGASLQDILFIRPVSFLPMEMSDLIECARRFLTCFGFTADAGVWPVFQTRISEEKSDGRFYGINTVHKVVREMIYRKQLNDATNGRDDSVIKKEDIVSLSKTYESRVPDGFVELDHMIGMEKVRNCVEEIVSQIELSRKNKNIGYPCLHMRFVGSPGTGKTTVARLVGRILKERGVLRNGHFFEYTGRDFCGKFIGETAPKTAGMCRDAYGSVLFIDEAYSLFRGDDSGRDFGREALDTLISEMENHRSDLVVIMAGYHDEMEELMKGNTGLESRMPYIIEFPNYTREALFAVFFKMIGDSFGYNDDFKTTVSEFFNAIGEDVLMSREFSNARFVRNLFERTCAKASMRMQFDKSAKFILTKEDFKIASSERSFQSLIAKKPRNIIGY